ncbi:MAG: hypothetical protein Q8N25_02060 [Methylotenera sp.]|uniref:hypothetical protein n=1 Tax=Methylotenera sp. TaxID=2051956 RepID=UPI002730BDD1|nr:hypothetical protein [Methylotenera sp.]MDP2103193.1 hypothetical protein [Methylotenera sp.]MDP2231818.1 hypothetical protein [Methylotenera sp.]MDP3059537.1 hypothetical protein [Methylotenera sp.]
MDAEPVMSLVGEEFLVIATNTEGATALLLAERILSAIEMHQPADIALTNPITMISANAMIYAKSAVVGPVIAIFIM